MKLDHLVILLADLKTHLKFYETLLPLIGFEKKREHVFGNQDGIFIDLKQAKEAGYEYRRFAPGLNHMGFVAPERESIAKVSQAMSEAGFDVPEVQTFEEGEAIFFKDPEGMRIELAFYFTPVE